MILYGSSPEFDPALFTTSSQTSSHTFSNAFRRHNNLLMPPASSSKEVTRLVSLNILKRATNHCLLSPIDNTPPIRESQARRGVTDTEISISLSDSWSRASRIDGPVVEFGNSWSTDFVYSKAPNLTAVSRLVSELLAGKVVGKDRRLCSIRWRSSENMIGSKKLVRFVLFSLMARVK